MLSSSRGLSPSRKLFGVVFDRHFATIHRYWSGASARRRRRARRRGFRIAFEQRSASARARERPPLALRTGDGTLER